MLQDAIHLPPDSETVAWLKSISQPQAPLTDMEDHWLAPGGLAGRCLGHRYGGH